MLSTSTDQPSRRGYIPPRDDKERFTVKRAEELARLSEKQNMPRYSGFLSDREQALSVAGLNRAGCQSYRFEGGYPQAERKVLCIEPEDTWQELPVVCVRVKPAALSQRMPAHKDYLGALLGLGLERDCIGDIVLEQDGSAAYVFVIADKQEFICTELVQAGSATVSAEPWDLSETGSLPIPEREIRTVSLSSLRLDAFLAAAMNCSRSIAGDYIRAGRVEINHIPAVNAHEDIFEEDIFTVRGKGRFCLCRIGGRSRKDRIFVEYFQY